MTSLPSDSTDMFSDSKLISGDDETNNTELESKELEEFSNPFGMSGAKLREIMESDAPTVDAVVLKADGTAQSVRYNSTPRVQDAYRLLNSHPTIVGEFRELQVIIVRGRFDGEDEDISKQPLNQHKLRYPFHTESIRGDILLYRVDDNANAADFTLQEYMDFHSKSSEDIGKIWTADPILEEDDDKMGDEEDDYEDNDNDDEMDAVQFDAMLSGIIRNQFLSRFQREPTEEELNAFKDTIAAKFVGGMPSGLDVVAEEADEGDFEDEEEEDDDSDYVPDAAEMAKVEAEDAALDAAEDEAVEMEDNDNDNNTDNDEESKDGSELDFTPAGAGLLAQVLASLGGQGADITEETMVSGLAALRDGLMNEDEINDDNEEEDDDEDDVDVAQLAREMKEALAIVKEVGKRDGQELADRVSRTFVELNGREPSEEELKAAFESIQAGLACEAEEDMAESIAARIETLPNNQTTSSNSNPCDLISDSEREALLKSASIVVTQDMANTAVGYFTQLTGRTPSNREFTDLLISVATTKFVENYCDDDDDECAGILEGEEDGPTVSDKENLDEQIAEFVAESEKVNGPRPVPSPAKPVAFYSPVVTPGSAKKKSRSRVFTSKSLDEQIAARATENFRNRYGREPDQSEMDTLKKFLGQTDSLVHTEPVIWDDEITSTGAGVGVGSTVCSDTTRKTLFSNDGSTAV